ncbi:Cyclin-D-binding Myb-like transcription factor 1 [Quillaja saponaria]|uniref:Cyclin-D-binding Myb-like transcription factor 1 n=1 Tax=Quillaja saponaria TaxID=32244 RepID=A0AAD7PAN2_QUISA|nr:Cyclin-D-binding Myb-like transcription factor 1 [Quillaja saponaria]
MLHKWLRIHSYFSIVLFPALLEDLAVTSNKLALVIVSGMVHKVIRKKKGSKSEKKKDVVNLSDNVDDVKYGDEDMSKVDGVGYVVAPNYAQDVASSEGHLLVGGNKKKKNERKKRKLGLNDDKVQEGRKKNKRFKNNEECRDLSIETNIGGEQNVHLKTSYENDLGSHLELETKNKKQKKLKKKNKHGIDAKFALDDICEDNNTREVGKGQTRCNEVEIDEMGNGKEKDNKNKKKKRKMERGDDGVVNGDIVNGKERRFLDEKNESKIERKKLSDDSSAEYVAQKPAKERKRMKDNQFKGSEGHQLSAEVETVDANAGVVGTGIGDNDKKKEKKKEKKKKKKKKMKKKEEEEKKKTKAHEDALEGKGNVETTDPSPERTPKGASKRVSFSDEVEVFTTSDGLVQGKRFTPEEDMMLMDAVYNYIETRGLGEEGIEKILNCRTHPEVKNCWKEIGAALPWRPQQSVYYRGHILFERDEKRKWTPEEKELIIKHHKKHGPDWKSLADALGKHRFHVKDTFRRIRLENMNKGQWSQEEYQNLFNLVNTDLRLKAFEEFKKSKYGMLRDNICWEAVSDKLETRSNSNCCQKWYNQLTSPMVAEGIWTDADDYRLLNALFTLDACCMEEVDWDCLLEHRCGDVCRKRWSQMVNHIGEHGNKSFAEQVEILSKRYCPDLLEAREAYDTKPVVP